MGCVGDEDHNNWDFINPTFVNSTNSSVGPGAQQTSHSPFFACVVSCVKNNTNYLETGVYMLYLHLEDRDRIGMTMAAVMK